MAGIQAQVAARVVQTLAALESMALASRANTPAPSWADITLAEFGGDIFQEEGRPFFLSGWISSLRQSPTRIGCPFSQAASAQVRKRR